MKALVLKGRGEVCYMEKPIPDLATEKAHPTVPGADPELGVILQPVVVSPCTSDVHTIWQGSPKKPDLTLGHECVARVVTAGSRVRDFRLGDLVLVSAITPDWGQPDVLSNPAHAGRNFSGHMIGKSIDGAFQEYFYLPYADQNLAHLPEKMDLDDALMCTDVMQTGFTACEEAGVRPGQTVVVYGTGAIGLAAVMACQCAGASRIFVVGSRRKNEEIARSLSIPSCSVEPLNYRTLRCSLPEGMHPLANSTGSQVVNYVLQQTGTKGADAVLICGGDDTVLAQALDMVKYGTGVISNVAYFGANPEADGIDGLILPKFSLGRGMAGKTLKFSLSKGGRTHLEKVVSEVRRHSLHPGIFITEHYDGLDKVLDALYDMKGRKEVKISVRIS